MSILTEFEFAFQKKESFILMMLVVIVYLLTAHTTLTSKHIVFAIPAIIIGYLYYTRTVDTNYATMHIQNEKLNKIDIASYPFLQEDIEVIDTLIQLEGLFYVNRLQYMEVYKRLNRFFQIYREFMDSKEPLARPTDLYQMAKESSSMAFNALLSFTIQVDSVIERRGIERAIEELKKRCQLFLNEMETKIQSDWNEGEINIHSQPIYPDEAAPSVLSDIQFSGNYNIY